VSARACRSPTDLVVWLPGLGDLAAAYGADIRSVVMPVMLARLSAFGLVPQAFSYPDNLVIAPFKADSRTWFRNIKDESRFLQWVQAEISRDPIVHDGESLYLQVDMGLLHSGKPIHGIELQEYSDGGRGAFWSVGRSPFLADWRRSYLADMRLAGQLLEDLRAGRLSLAFQPISLLDGSAEGCLYSEALLRRSESEPSAGYALPEAITALERLGLIGRLDQSVVWTVVRALERHPDQRLGCNVSAMSLRDDAWWRVLLDYLGMHRHLARRLTLEITETSAVSQSKDVFALIAGLRVRGTRIALDDVGVGYTTWEFMAYTRPDVVKIDRSILTRSCSLRHSPDVLRNLVRVCADYSPCVVIEGIETDAEMSAAKYAGAQGVQGYLIGRPSLHPPTWLGQTSVCVTDAYVPTCATHPDFPIPPPPRTTELRRIEGKNG